jgi:hypothetical protein
MADHWEFVGAAYGLAVLVLGGYWRRLGRKQRELTIAGDSRDQRSRQPSMPGHPRPEPASRGPLQT